MWVEITNEWTEGWVIAKDGYQHYAVRNGQTITDKRFSYTIEVHKVWR